MHFSYRSEICFFVFIHGYFLNEVDQSELIQCEKKLFLKLKSQDGKKLETAAKYFLFKLCETFLFNNYAQVQRRTKK